MIPEFLNVLAALRKLPPFVLDDGLEAHSGVLFPGKLAEGGGHPQLVLSRIVRVKPEFPLGVPSAGRARGLMIAAVLTGRFKAFLPSMLVTMLPPLM